MNLTDIFYLFAGPRALLMFYILNDNINISIVNLYFLHFIFLFRQFRRIISQFFVH